MARPSPDDDEEEPDPAAVLNGGWSGISGRCSVKKRSWARPSAKALLSASRPASTTDTLGWEVVVVRSEEEEEEEGEEGAEDAGVCMPRADTTRCRVKRLCLVAATRQGRVKKDMEDKE